MPASPTVPQAGKTFSPKVVVPFLVTMGLAAAQGATAGVVATITPEALSPIVGPLWASTLATAIAGLLQGLLGYLKRDPLRDMTPQLHPQTIVRAVETPQGVAAEESAPRHAATTADVEDDGYDAENPLGLPAGAVHPQT